MKYVRQETGEERPYPNDIKILLDEISSEPVPENLLKLARQLQQALEARLAEEKKEGS